jgi:DNA-binding transcriptional LysR family regulator
MSDIDSSKIAQLDGSLLLVLRELLRLRRTTLVAERLRLSQSAVSHALGRLRRLFGDPLFVRRPHGLEPTRHALELAPRVDALLDAMNDALGLSARFEPVSTTRGFRIAAPDSISTLLAPALLEAFSKQAPEARFAFSQQLGGEALDALRRDHVDIAVGRFRPDLNGLVVERLFEDRHVLVARTGHPELRSGKLTRAVYRQLDRVQISVGGDFRSLELEPEGEIQASRRVVAAVPRFMIALALVGQSDAVAVAPLRLAQRYGSAFGIRAHDLPFAVEPIRVLAVRKPHPDPGTEWLVSLIKGLHTS